MRAISITFFAALLMSGCETAQKLERTSDLTRDLRENEVSFILQQDVTVPAGRARLFLQGGGVVGGRNLYQPHCIVKIDSIDHEGFLITTDNFNVVRIQRSTVQIASQSDRPAGSILVAGSYNNSNSDRFHDGYHFWLQSDTQPAVMRLTCYGVYERPSRLRPPTLEEIGAALGEVGSLLVE